MGMERFCHLCWEDQRFGMSSENRRNTELNILELQVLQSHQWISSKMLLKIPKCTNSKDTLYRNKITPNYNIVANNTTRWPTNKVMMMTIAPIHLNNGGGGSSCNTTSNSTKVTAVPEHHSLYNAISSVTCKSQTQPATKTKTLIE